MSGYVRIHRSLLGHPAFRNDAEAMAFAWLVAKAAWQQTRVRYKDRIIGLARGQLAVSVRDFANAMDRDKGWCERLLKRLKNEAMVETHHETGVNLVTICNYEEYQARGLRSETLDETPEGTGARQAQDTEQVREEVKKISSEPKGSSPRAWTQPVGVRDQVWKDLLGNRRRKKLGLSDTAWKKFNDDLARVSLQTGIPPPQLIEQCTAKGWGAIYDPRDNRNERNDRDPTTVALERLIGPHAGTS